MCHRCCTKFNKLAGSKCMLMQPFGEISHMHLNNTDIDNAIISGCVQLSSLPLICLFTADRGSHVMLVIASCRELGTPFHATCLTDKQQLAVI